MNDFTNYDRLQNSNSKSGVEDFTTKVLIPLGAILIAAISVVFSTNKLPSIVLWTMILYLAIVLVKILVSPTKTFTSKVITKSNRILFSKKMHPELLQFSSELNQLLASDRENTIPYFINNQFSKLSSDINTLSCLDRNRQQFQILQSWSFFLTDLLRNSEKKNLMLNAVQLSNLVTWFIWACVWLHQVVNNTGVQTNKDIVSDWNTAVRKISDFSSRVERLMKSINEKYNEKLCTDYFQEVKPL